MRIVLSALAGLVISFSLFLAMTYLIDQPDPPPVQPVYVPPIYANADIPPPDTKVVIDPVPLPVVEPQPIYIHPPLVNPPIQVQQNPSPPIDKIYGNDKGTIIGLPPIDPPIVEAPVMTVLVNSKVKYPKKALERNLEGYVTVENTVNNLGQVVNVRIVDSSNPIFDSAARNAVILWKYDQSQKAERLHKTRIAFNLD